MCVFEFMRVRILSRLFLALNPTASVIQIFLRLKRVYRGIEIFFLFFFLCFLRLVCYFFLIIRLLLFGFLSAFQLALITRGLLLGDHLSCIGVLIQLRSFGLFVVQHLRREFFLFLYHYNNPGFTKKY